LHDAHLLLIFMCEQLRLRSEISSNFFSPEQHSGLIFSSPFSANMAVQASTNASLTAVVNKFTPTLVLACSITALLNLLFGMDTTSFGGVQNIPSFGRQFGTQIGPHGTYLLSASRSSFMSSVAFAGKLFGALVRTS